MQVSCGGVLRRSGHAEASPLDRGPPVDVALLSKARQPVESLAFLRRVLGGWTPTPIARGIWPISGINCRWRCESIAAK